MIEVFEGRLGGGKTYSAVSRIALQLSQGGTVVTNIRLIPEKLSEFVSDAYGVIYESDQLWCLPNEKIPEFHLHVPWGALRGSGEDLRVLVVVDEAHLYFNSRDWANCSRQLLAFLTQSDKVSVDIIFISQSALNIDKQFGRLVQYIWRFRDLAKWKVPGLGIAYPFPQILCCQFDYDGITLLNRQFVRKDKRIFGCYETAALLTDFPNTAGKIARKELKKVERDRSYMLKFILPIVFLIGVVSVYSLYKKFKPDSSGVVKTEAVSSSSSSSAAVTREKDSKGEEAKAAYEIYDEEFRAYSQMERAIKTDSGWYKVGEMSAKGFVMAVSDRRARLALPDGRVGWVVTRDKSDVIPPPSAAVQASGTAGVQAGGTSSLKKGEL